MSNTEAPKTKFAKGNTPFEPRKKPVRKDIDLSIVEKCSDPYMPERKSVQSKYEELFAGVKEGDCFRVHGGNDERTALARALRVYLEKSGIKGLVRQNGRTDDGIGRVWFYKDLSKKGGQA